MKLKHTRIAPDLSVAVHISRSKTDQTGKGAGIIIEPYTSKLIYPGYALNNYFSNFRTKGGELLLIHADWSLLTSYQFLAIHKKALMAAGYSAHSLWIGSSATSLRIGACSMASVRGISDSKIKRYGNWTSIACRFYIRIPSNKIAGMGMLL